MKATGLRFAVLFASMLTLFGPGIAHAAIPASERAVLENLYAYTNGPGWAHQDGWNGAPGTECNWYGTTCNAAGTTVTGIDLSGNGLYGPLPPLAGLTNLETFDIHQTATGGIGAYNSLFGPIPPLNGLKHLKLFDANNTFFNGGIPSLTGLSHLQLFGCVRCGLTGPIPSLSGLTSLQTFDVSYNQLSGSIPSLAGLSQLRYFRVGGQLTGAIPDPSGLTNLQTYIVGGYQLTGGVPDLVDLPNLQTFEVYGFLSGQIGSLSNLPSLETFDMSGDRLTGNIPPLAGLPNLQLFSVGGNLLTGSVPELSGLTSLQNLGLSYNQLSGLLPAVPQSLIESAGAHSYASATACPNLLTPASDPPTQTDLDWNTVTKTTPWSQDCAPDPVWKTYMGVASSMNPSTVGQSVTFKAVVHGMNPTGTMTFTSKSDTPGTTAVTTLCDSVPLVDSVATCTVDNIPANGSTYSIVGHYSGDADNAPADNSIVPVYQLVNYAPITATVTANPVQAGEPVDIAGIGSFYSGTTMEFDDARTALCSGVTPYAVDGHLLGHCVTQFVKAGPHVLFLKALSNGPQANDGALPLIVNVVAAKAFDADQFALTGSWYNPPTSGQGLEIEVYPDLVGNGKSLLFGGWFTDDESGHEQWVTLQGDLSSSHGGSYDLKIGQNSGGNFDAQPITEATQIGTATLTFYDCTHAALVYNFDDGRGGTIPYVRLTSPTACSSTVPAAPPVPLPDNYNDVLHSGAWYDPATSGQGLMVDIDPSITTFFAAWYTFTPAASADTGIARQRWFTLQDNTYTPGDLSLHDVPIISVNGGVFNQPSTTDAQQVGTAQVTFTSCTTMTLQYTFTAGEFQGLSGTINERAIVPDTPCQQ